MAKVRTALKCKTELGSVANRWVLKYTDYLVKGLTLPEATVKMRAIKCFFRGIRTRGGSTPLDKYLVDHASSHVDVISYLSTRFPGYFTKTENAIVNTIAGL